MNAYYAICKVYKKGLLSTHYLGNVHYFWLPCSKTKAICFTTAGHLSKQTSGRVEIWRGLFTMDVDKLGSAAESYLMSKDYKVIETLPCKVVEIDHDRFKVVFPKKGKYYKSDLEINYSEALSLIYGGHLYSVRGEISLQKDEVDDKVISGKAAKIVTDGIKKSAFSWIHNLD
jgi:hypothetical protein